MKFACGLRKKHSGLSGRVPAAHNDDLFPLTQLGLHEGRAVIDTESLEPHQVWNGWLIVLGAGSDDNGLGRELLPVVEFDLVWLAAADEADRSVSDHHFRAKLLGLVQRSRCQFMARNARWKSQVVLDLGTRSRLSTGSARLNH